MLIDGRTPRAAPGSRCSPPWMPIPPSIETANILISGSTYCTQPASAGGTAGTFPFFDRTSR